MTQALEAAPLAGEDRAHRPPWPIRRMPSQGAARPIWRGLALSVAQSLEQRRLFILLPVAMIAGLLSCAGLAADPSPVLLGAGAGVLLLAAAVPASGLARARTVAMLAAFWLGFCLLPVHGLVSGTQMLQRAAFGTYQVRVDEIIEETETEKRVIVSAIRPMAEARQLPVRRARLVIRNGPDLSPGDVIEGAFRFAPVPGPIYPGGFDTQLHAYFDGIGTYGNSTSPPRIIETGSEWAPEHVVDAIRRGISAKIDAGLPQPSAGIARAIINGDQSAVTDDVREVMATAGIVHVLSVSGLHLTIVAGGVFWLVRLLLAGIDPIVVRVSVKWLAAVVGIAAALGYFAISGGNVAAFRSTLMILLVFGAVLAGRRALTMRNVAIAAVVVIATDPASVLRPSFQLSFAAVVALVGAYENFRSERSRDAGPVVVALRYAWGIVVTSLVAGAATLLFSVYHFQQTSPLGVVGNLFSLPLVGFVMMPAAVMSVLAMPFGLEGPFLLAMGWSIDRMVDMAGIVSVWSEHLRASPLLTPMALVAGLVALGWFAFFRDRWRLVGPALLAPVVLLFGMDQRPDVLIADTTQAVAVRGISGLELADGKIESFALSVWRETYSEAIEVLAPVKCDSVACIGESSVGFSYAIVDDPAGFAEECGRDLIITRLRAPGYCRALTVDADALRQHGVHWLRWDAGRGAFEVRRAIEATDRAWRIRS